MTETHTAESHRAMLEALRAMRHDKDCPNGCQAGWISNGLCGGHLCDWPGHHFEE